MDQLYGEFNKIVDADEYVKYNVASTRYSIKGLPGNYTFTLQVKYRESKEQTQYVKSQAKAIIGSIVKSGMDDHEKVKAIHDYVVKHVSKSKPYSKAVQNSIANLHAALKLLGFKKKTYILQS